MTTTSPAAAGYRSRALGPRTTPTVLIVDLGQSSFRIRGVVLAEDSCLDSIVDYDGIGRADDRAPTLAVELYVSASV